MSSDEPRIQAISLRDGYNPELPHPYTGRGDKCSTCRGLIQDHDSIIIAVDDTAPADRHTNTRPDAAERPGGRA